LREPRGQDTSDKRILIDDPLYHFFQASFSPDGRWVSFVALPVDQASRLVAWVAPAVGAPPSKWTRIASSHDWVDKPRWAPDGRTLYFISKQGSSFYNLWGARFDPDRGMPIGEPFKITKFDSPGLVISPDIAGSEIGIAQRRAVLTMATVTGNIWMLENVDR
jgi:Tol biopolymer transport system component